MTSTEKVWAILKMAMYDYMTYHCGYIIFEGQKIIIHNGWIAQSVLANPTITSSTEGKRRFRELRAERSDKYEFQITHEGRRYFYRILPREISVQGAEKIKGVQQCSAF